MRTRGPASERRGNNESCLTCKPCPDSRHDWLMCAEFGSEQTCGTEAGSYLRRMGSCITQLKAQGPSRTCNENKEEDLVGARMRTSGSRVERSALALPGFAPAQLSDTKVYESSIRASLGPLHYGSTVPIGTVLNLRTSQKCESVPKRARI